MVHCAKCSKMRIVPGKGEMAGEQGTTNWRKLRKWARGGGKFFLLRGNNVQLRTPRMQCTLPSCQPVSRQQGSCTIGLWCQLISPVAPRSLWICEIIFWHITHPLTNTHSHTHKRAGGGHSEELHCTTAKEPGMGRHVRHSRGPDLHPPPLAIQRTIIPPPESLLGRLQHMA